MQKFRLLVQLRELASNPLKDPILLQIEPSPHHLHNLPLKAEETNQVL